LSSFSEDEIAAMVEKIANIKRGRRHVDVSLF
jgi:hypothetical protein